MSSIEPTQGDIDNLILDAEIHSAAHGILAVIPQWFQDLNDRHDEARARLAAEGDPAAVVFATHDLVFDFDGPECGKGSSYPCRALRAVHDGQDVWADLTAKWPPDWQVDFDRWDTCGPEETS